MSAPNIRAGRQQKHDECWRQDWPLSEHQHRLGDIRVCIHGRIQVLTETSVDAPVQGPGTHGWRTLSKFWNPIDYRRATEAIRSTN
ncbi:hypothetical protein [Arthrobacter sp. UYCu712]|uniref:hypothetical protein n=1 Tax=Arthrobacter sp. UYCu712 TaxID=3156340 RepID=UPI00339AC702